jgi:predicted PurR-regulated permease PerM
LKELQRLSPLRREHEEAIIGKFKEITVATFEGNLLTAILQGAAGGLVFLIFGLPSPLLWAAVMAFLSLVPLVGTALVWGPVVVYYLLTGAVVKGLLLLVLCGAVVGSIDNLVKPLLIRRRAAIPTLWVFVGVLGGVGVFGFLGFVLGPLMVAVLFALIEIYKVEFRKELGEKLGP